MISLYFHPVTTREGDKTKMVTSHHDVYKSTLLDIPPYLVVTIVEITPLDQLAVVHPVTTREGDKAKRDGIKARSMG